MSIGLKRRITDANKYLSMGHIQTQKRQTHNSRQIGTKNGLYLKSNSSSANFPTTNNKQNPMKPKRSNLQTVITQNQQTVSKTSTPKTPSKASNQHSQGIYHAIPHTKCTPIIIRTEGHNAAKISPQKVNSTKPKKGVNKTSTPKTPSKASNQHSQGIYHAIPHTKCTPIIIRTEGHNAAKISPQTVLCEHKKQTYDSAP
ncbi:hypothetical protein CHS0354_031954 [Potamilus streckersoni]|uniref:Uncharacterized protein n=1 Tax=Potamilus streckersoni TaxID=2493646 RepID=A0AAE0S3E7_9BIVA|nr:hypothetical protein CHS0354_031954 [Potamilus streckersoni]